MPDRTLTVTTKVRDLASRELTSVGKTGAKAGGSIAGGFIKAQIAIAGFKMALRAVSNLVRSLTVEVAEQGDKIAKMSTRLGIGTEVLSKFGHAAKLAGVEFNAFAMGLQRQTRRVSEAAAGTGEALKALVELERYGLPDAAELNRMLPEDQILALADAFDKVRDRSDKVRLGFKLWDAEGVGGMLQMFATDMRGAADEAERLGIVWTKMQAKIAEEFIDSMERYRQAMFGVKKAVAMEFLPSLIESLNKIATWMAKHRGKIKTFLVNVVKTVGDLTVQAIEIVLRFLGNVMDAVAQAKTSIARSFGLKPVQDYVDLWEGAGKKVETSGDKMVAAFRKIREEFNANVSKVLDELQTDSLPPLVVKGPTEESLGAWGDFIAGMKEASTVTLTLAKDLGAMTVQSTLGNFTTALDAVIDRTKSWKDAFKDMVNSIIRDLIRLAAQRMLLAGFSSVAGGAGFGGLFTSGGADAGTPAVAAAGAGKSVVVTQNVYPSPGMDEQMVADLAAASIQKELRTSTSMRGAIRKTAREGLY